MKKLFGTIMLLSLSLSLLGLLTALSSCGSKEPASVKKRKSLEKELKGSASHVKLSANESLAITIKNQELFREYNIENYDYLDQNRLYEKINGAADGYVKNHGFKGCGYLELKSKLDKIPVIIYVMDMDKGIHGFGIYSSERNRENEFVNVGSEGYFGHSGLTFWKNKYYVKVELQKKMEKSKQREILLSLARRIANQIPKDPSILAGFKSFPLKGRLDKGKQFYKSNYLGLKDFENVYEVSYQSGKKDRNGIVFKSLFKSEKQVLSAIRQYQKAMGLKVLSDAKSDFRGKVFLNEDPLEKTRVIFFVRGTILIGLSGFSSVSEENSVLKAMVQEIK